MLGLEPLRQEARAPLWEEGIRGGHGSWVGMCLLLVPSCQLQARHREGLTLFMPHLQQTSYPLSCRGAQLF